MDEVQNTTDESEGTAMTLQEQLAKIDGFPVEWAGRNKDGHYQLSASKFRVTTAIPELFGQNISKWNNQFDEAVALAEESGEPEFHNFGECSIRRGSLRRLPNGKWAMDLKVPKHFRRKCEAPFEVEVLDKDGNVTGSKVEVKEVTEKMITVLLTQVEPLVGDKHPLSRRYVQRDTETASQLRLNADSDKIESGVKASGPRKPKAKATRISPAAARARLAKARKQG